ncbi:hypothetical protein BGZ65_003476 [Modicella reniformis]|uniref:Uncharacterized protein n=1 Tax=Modicella reniformis TaxID=1440133 RepID=A0A9P6LYU3_9FUNG|nr:hypothetical protein BGZ65_003476 [Modicella reniformis]
MIVASVPSRAAFISSSYMSKQQFVQSSDTFPRAFVVVPLEHSHLRPHRAIRLTVPCQAPSITDGCDDSFHMTDHGGYTIKYPGDFGHRYRNGIKLLTKATIHFTRVSEIVASFMINVPSHPGNVAVSALSSLHQTVDNRDRLNRAGIDPDNVFSAQLVTDSHQKRAMMELLQNAEKTNGQPNNITGDLKSIVLDGRTIWICDRCYDCLQRGECIEVTNYLTLSQYIHLVKRESEVNATLCNPESVVVLTETFTKPTKTKKMTIHLEPVYFGVLERVKGSRFNSIAYLFNNLGTALQRQKVLTHLEIHGNSTNGELHAGLQAVLQRRFVFPGCFLQGKDLRMKCKRLKELTLQGVLVNTEQAANNLRILIGMCSGLKRLTVTGVKEIPMWLISHSLETPKEVRRQFAKLEQLELNPGIEDGCRSIFELLQAKQVKMEDTGITSEASRYIATYLSRRRWANLGIHDGYASYLDQHLN